MSPTYTHQFNTAAYKGAATINTGLFIDGEWVAPVEGGEIEVINPATGAVITKVSAGTKADVDKAVAAAKKAFKTTWGSKAPGALRAKLIGKLADLLEKNVDEFAALESLNIGKVFAHAKHMDLAISITILRYFAGWADKIHGTTIESTDAKVGLVQREPYGVCGQITPWNGPIAMIAMKVAPALATGNVIVLKPSEITPFTALRFADLVVEAGFPPGVVNIVNGFGHTVGQAIAEHPQISKVAFTGSTVTGRKILKAAADSNLKPVSLELGGKSPTIVFDDADLDQAVKWAAAGVFSNMGQMCVAGSRIFVQEGVYDEFLAKISAAAKALGDAAGDPFAEGTQHGPQISKTQVDRVMSYIESGKAEGATVHVGGVRIGDEGYFVQPTVFTDVNKDMKIAREEIFGPVTAVFKFKTEEEVIELANDTVYGLAAYVFSENIRRGLRVANALEAGSVAVNSANLFDPSMPFGGYKQSGIGRELGEQAIESYTQAKSIHINLGIRL
ncbi:indole-3-acetaldehyde dehydrogenase [Coprinopsis marcescibilis]|uniref:Indole-3-acetaldehyde dehydrogenase n=1 Tax=Coprinopsis marcescibilis TaxID=230819 RepID=A0A5C3KBW6_COPMA|nr:indole-3-acetaldehyde dehydrogenase [Coprinopsis marcescibilis]